MGILSALFGNKDAGKLAETLKQGAYLVDVRTPGEFATGSVKGAVNIPLDTLHMQLGKLKGKQNIVVFCRSGARSSQARLILNQNGFQNVVDGGSWQDVNRAISG
jgi:rhodanese-related sulfurtransferase